MVNHHVTAEEVRTFEELARPFDIVPRLRFPAPSSIGPDSGVDGRRSRLFVFLTAVILMLARQYLLVLPQAETLSRHSAWRQLSIPLASSEHSPGTFTDINSNQ